MTIGYVQMAAVDKDPNSIIWVPGPNGWTWTKGVRFTYNVLLVEGTLETIAEELQALRDTCPQQPAPGWHTAYVLCRVHKSPPEEGLEPCIKRTPNGMLVSLRMVVTNEPNPWGGPEFTSPPPGEPLPQFGPVIKEYIEAYLKEKEDAAALV